jgi:transcriptional regulator with XRE-family HTH domain
MQTLHDRLQWALDAAGVSLRGASVAAGLAPAAVGLILSRRGDIELDTARALAGALGVSLDWLASGTGDTPDPAAIRAAVEAARGDAA